MRSNVLLFWTGQASALLASAIVGGLLARVLGRSGLGVYVVIQTAAAAAAVVLSFGLTHALLYHVGGNKSRLVRPHVGGVPELGRRRRMGRRLDRGPHGR